ncbi:MAG: 16S rRNA (guanine(527)-N(7))-methyltransferase RsmG [Deltaproteobacteria bacterium]|nr:16S rRNA (guanine(527)-N(7))-methyltransferase RsmG [Deltaproteobacteria bacterium]
MLSDPHFKTYLELLLKWNKVYNLTAITDPKEVQIKHFEDSLSALPFLPKTGRILDIGTGGGFPGVPLKIARPDLEVVLLDAVRKKITFCEAAIRELGLKGIKAIHGRVEDENQIRQLGLFDVIITRATFSLPEFLTLALPYSSPTTLAIAMKGRDWKVAGFKAEENGWKLKEAFDYELSEDLGSRSLVVFSRIYQEQVSPS